jgi:ABC-type spermidine/putrescine transport system permease subunit II
MEPLRITFPGISPVLLSCWLLAFTLWLDDLVIVSFVTGLRRRLC